MIIFSEHDNSNHFLLISSFTLNSVKFQNGQNNLFFTKDVWAIPLKAIFSSPEHKVLMVNFCDRPMCGVRRPSCVFHNFFKHLLLLNHWANLDETWQGCSLGEALPKLFKRLNSNHNSGCHGNQKEKNSKIFENLLL